MLVIQNLYAQFEHTPILQGVDLTISPGELHVLLGPNGSGKSTLGKVLLAHPLYQKTKGKMVFEGKDLDELETWERARKGIFLAHQSPPAIAGVSAEDALRASEKAYVAEGEKSQNIMKFKKNMKENLKAMNLSQKFAKRYLNEGASGGERRKMEIVSLLTLGARLAFLDEIDSGIDVDALKAVVDGINEFLAPGNTSVVLVTHQEKILHLLSPTKIHIFCDGRIVHSGGKEVAEKVHSQGFSAFEACKNCISHGFHE